MFSIIVGTKKLAGFLSVTAGDPLTPVRLNTKVHPAAGVDAGVELGEVRAHETRLGCAPATDHQRRDAHDRAALDEHLDQRDPDHSGPAGDEDFGSWVHFFFSPLSLRERAGVRGRS
jgi:hypothetical protein